MGLGRFQINVDLDTATDPDDTILLAAPGARETIYILWLSVITTTAEASTHVLIEDGAGGDTLDIILTTAVGSQVRNYGTVPHTDGLKLTVNTLLNASTVGGTSQDVRVVGEVEVR